MGRRVNNNVDWTEVERRYILNDGSLRDIAKDHGITHAAIQYRVKKGGWIRDGQLAKLPVNVKQTQTAKVHAKPINASQQRQVNLGKCSPENAELIIEKVAAGAFPYTAAGALGIDHTLFQQWLERDVAFKALVWSTHGERCSAGQAKHYDIGMSGDARALERYLASAEKGSYADTGRAGGATAIQVILNVDRTKSPEDIVDATPEPGVIDHQR